ncbi:MAG: hypothetical protein Ct9H300mP22_5440 [Gammaproteobacteria bacterium]|nr:MAG: hypothetical protein Ct9H300mP22_5440 [Gammaproteobacteria bacterium]
MTDLEYLFLSDNQIEDVSAIKDLTNLQVLRLENNEITEVQALVGLRNIRELSLAQNPSLFNVQPLLANEGLGRGDELDLRFTYVRCLTWMRLLIKE